MRQHWTKGNLEPITSKDLLSKTLNGTCTAFYFQVSLSVLILRCNLRIVTVPVLYSSSENVIGVFFLPSHSDPISILRRVLIIHFSFIRYVSNCTSSLRNFCFHVCWDGPHMCKGSSPDLNQKRDGHQPPRLQVQESYFNPQQPLLRPALLYQQP